MPEAMRWPQKTREIQTAVSDSTRWNGFKFRDDDIIVATYAKTGTTWTQQIIGQLIFHGKPGLAASDASPWVDFRPIPLEKVVELVEAQQHRRFLKTHLPIDALVFSPKAKYLYIVRDGRDVAWSLYNHHAGFSPAAYEMMNDTPGRVGPPVEPPTSDIVQYFHEWLEDSSLLLLGATFWDHVQGWWDHRHLPNILLVHFNHLKADLPGQMRRIANFLGVEVDEARWPQMIEHCSIEYMRGAAAESPIFNDLFNGGSKTFFNKGTNGRWKDVLSSADLEVYEKTVKTHLTPECARWMATGEIEA